MIDTAVSAAGKAVGASTHAAASLLLNHLWQSTWFALAAALLVLLFRGNSAAVRFNIWLAASLKFLIPLPLLVVAGRHWNIAPLASYSPVPHPSAPPIPLLTLDQLTEPATATTLSIAPAHSFWTLILLAWAAGTLLLLARRITQWLRLNSIAWASSSVPSEAPLPIRETSSALEPGLFGIFWPVLLLPKGIATRLAPAQLETIVAHEVHHWRRKDNLTAALHMLVETLFWFHPLVWWLGHRMIVERERAVDEAVIRSGGDRETYAEGILKVCQFYTEPPLPCTSAVSGGTLRKRIEEIMSHRNLTPLHIAKKCLLGAAAVAGVAGPIAVGLLSAPYVLAQEASEMKHYQNAEWSFGLDVPKRWNAFPPVSANSPTEVIRFMSNEQGSHALIVFRNPNDPNGNQATVVANIRKVLTKSGFGNFVTGETTVGARKALTLDADRPMPQGAGTWSIRQYYFFDGTLMWALGFGSSVKDTNTVALWDQMAKTFTFAPS